MYLRSAAACPVVALGDPITNAERIISMAEEASAKGVRILVTPELSISGYSCADLFGQDFLLDSCLDALETTAKRTAPLPIAIVAGAPIRYRHALYNCAVVIAGGQIHGIVPKAHLPNYSEFYERRWFRSGIDLPADASVRIGNRDIPMGLNLLFNIGNAVLGVEICEDLWVPNPPSGHLCQNGADVIANLSATDENIGKHSYLLSLIKQQSARCRSGYIYASAGRGESSTDLVFSGNGIIAEDGTLLAESPRFSLDPTLTIADIDIERLRHDRQRVGTYHESVIEAPQPNIIDLHLLASQEPADLRRRVDRLPFVPDDVTRRDESCGEIISIQTWGLMQRLSATRCKCLVIGISGGLDSTLALLVAVKAFDDLGFSRSGIIGVTMPGFGTTTRTHSNAVELMKLLGVTSMEIPIGPSVKQHFKDIGQSQEVHDATYENGQARERTQILMDLANKHGGMVLGTGDLSELALGWCTYNGDHMSMYAVNSSIPKTLVRHLVEWFASHAPEDEALVLRDIIDTPISPELIPAADGRDDIEQKTEDLVGPYELHDFFLYHTLRHGSKPAKILRLAEKAFDGDYDRATLLKWLRNFYRRFFSQQFKRSCMPDGPKVGSVCLSPRGDWRMPSDATAKLWLDEVDKL